MASMENVPGGVDRAGSLPRTNNDDIQPAAVSRPVTAPPPAKGTPVGVESVSLDDQLLEVEASLIDWALKATGGNKSRAAALLHIKRSTLGDRINRCRARRVRADGVFERTAPAFISQRS